MIGKDRGRILKISLILGYVFCSQQFRKNVHSLGYAFAVLPVCGERSERKTEHRGGQAHACLIGALLIFQFRNGIRFSVDTSKELFWRCSTGLPQRF